MGVDVAEGSTAKGFVCCSEACRDARSSGSSWLSDVSGAVVGVLGDSEPFGCWPLDVSVLSLFRLFVLLAVDCAATVLALFRFGFLGCCVLLVDVSVSELREGGLGMRKAVIAARFPTLD